MRFKKGRALLILVISMSVSFSSTATETIKVAFGDALEPWVMPETGDGINVEIIEQAMQPLGYKIEKVYLSYARRLKSYQQGLVDVASDINHSTMEELRLEGFLSDTAYTYVNYAYSLKKNNYRFTSMQELANYRLLSWQGAIEHLSDEYAEMARSNPLYSEHHDQSVQVKMLYLQRVDVIQMDEQIFNYYRAKVGSQGVIDTSSEIDQFSFFGQSPNGFLFRNTKMRDDFNMQLEKMLISGKYQEILTKYALPN